MRYAQQTSGQGQTHRACIWDYDLTFRIILARGHIQGRFYSHFRYLDGLGLSRYRRMGPSQQDQESWLCAVFFGMARRTHSLSGSRDRILALVLLVTSLYARALGRLLASILAIWAARQTR